MPTLTFRTCQSFKETSLSVAISIHEAIAKHYHDDPATLPWLKDCFQADERERLRAAVVMVIDGIYPNDLEEQMRQWLQRWLAS